MVFESQCPTDCLIIKGNYSTVSLAVYGYVIKNVSQPQHPNQQQQSSQLQKSPEGKFYMFMFNKPFAYVTVSQFS